MRKLIRLAFAFAVAALALLSHSAHAFGAGGYYVCVNDCYTECPAYCYNWICEDLVDGCEETSGIACHCYSF
jgi:hypothetical protein